VILLYGLATLLVLGWTLVLGVMIWTGTHVVQQRPRWYVGKVLRASAVGAVTAALCALALLLSSEGGAGLSLTTVLTLLGMFSAAGLGWGGGGAAAWYARYRFERHGPPP
jgi:hypothetical protein